VTRRGRWVSSTASTGQSTWRSSAPASKLEHRVLDANVVIAALDRRDAHHRRGGRSGLGHDRRPSRAAYLDDQLRRGTGQAR
jgi:hypothetical protein